MKKQKPDTFSNQRFRELTEEFIQGDFDRAVLIRCYVDDKTIGELCGEFSLSESAVKRIVGKGGKKVFKLMEKEVIELERLLNQ